jgi:Ca2+-dependent lipid-binding protein
MYQHVSKLQGMNEGSEMPGELHWEVGFFGKPKLRAELRTDGKKKDLPENLKDNPAFEDEKGVITTDEEDAITHTPPDPLWPSGILSIVVHQIVNLQLANIKGSNGNRKGREYEPAKPSGENTEEQGDDLPTSYCKIILNDELVRLSSVFFLYSSVQANEIIDLPHTSQSLEFEAHLQRRNRTVRSRLALRRRHCHCQRLEIQGA